MITKEKAISKFLLASVPAEAVLTPSSKNGLTNHPDEIPSYVGYHLKEITKPNRATGAVPIEISLIIYEDDLETGISVDPSFSRIPTDLAIRYSELVIKVAKIGATLTAKWGKGVTNKKED
jgi:hypothetical protein